MKVFWGLVFMVLSIKVSVAGVSKNVTTRPKSVTAGAILTFNSTVGKVARIAIQAAVNDVNSDPSVLGGTKLNIKMQDTNFSGFRGIIEGNI